MDRHDFKELANGQLPWRYRLNKASAPELYTGMETRVVMLVLASMHAAPGCGCSAH
jgi:hypothetical protein